MKEFVHNFCCDTLTKHHVNEKPSESVKKKVMTASSDKGEDDDDVGVLSFDLPGVLAEERKAEAAAAAAESKCLFFHPSSNCYSAENTCA
eukprot:scaffold17669_cov88-Skeletonema_marinoi.AAC.2